MYCCTALQGIDLFDMGYLTEATAGGYALTFPVSSEAEQAQQAQQQEERQPGAANGALVGDSASASAAADLEAAAAAADAAADSGQDDSKLNLWALACRLDKRPLLPGCGCFACGSHTRAYVHHLLQTHEMTAQARPKPCLHASQPCAQGTHLACPACTPRLHSAFCRAWAVCRCCWRLTTPTTTCSSSRLCAAAWRRAALRPTEPGSWRGGSAGWWGNKGKKGSRGSCSGGLGLLLCCCKSKLARLPAAHSVRCAGWIYTTGALHETF